eukprot:1550555-Pyramimonas_sp.AAC.1
MGRWATRKRVAESRFAHRQLHAPRAHSAKQHTASKSQSDDLHRVWRLQAGLKNGMHSHTVAQSHLPLSAEVPPYPVWTRHAPY